MRGTVEELGPRLFEIIDPLCIYFAHAPKNFTRFTRGEGLENISIKKYYFVFSSR